MTVSCPPNSLPDKLVKTGCSRRIDYGRTLIICLPSLLLNKSCKTFIFTRFFLPAKYYFIQEIFDFRFENFPSIKCCFSTQAGKCPSAGRLCRHIKIVSHIPENICHLLPDCSSINWVISGGDSTDF